MFHLTLPKLDDYFSCGAWILAAALCTLFTSSYFRLAFEYLSNKEVLNFRGKTKSRVEKLYNRKERTLLTFFLIDIAAIATTVVSLNYLLNARLLVADVYLFTAVKLLIIGAVLAFTIKVVPNLFTKARLSAFRSFGFLVFYAADTLLAPFSIILLKIKSIGFNMEHNTAMGSISMEELSDAVEIVSKTNTPEEKRLLTGMVRFVNADVSDIMCHRTDMVAVNIDSSFEEVLTTITESGFSRIPVYREVLDNIVGILYAKDIIAHIDDHYFDWKTILRKPYFVSDQKMINELLVNFQKKKIHLAIVVDEYGSTQGIVSMEDILEEIVGEIEDESDIEEPFYSKIDENTYVFEGKTTLSDFAEVLRIDHEEVEEIRGDAETLAGLIIELRQDMPKVGADTDILGYKLRVVKVEKQRIERIKVTKLIDNAADSEN